MVGYNKATPQYSYHMMSMPFTAVDGGEVKIGSVQGSFEMEDNIQFSYMDEDGYVQFKTYIWWPEDTIGDVAGWYDDDIFVGDSLTIPTGAAVWFITNSGEPTPDGLTTSGAVLPTFIEHNGFPETFNMIGSAFPVGFNPNAETVTWSGLEMEDQIQVAYMDEDGYVQFITYMWWPEDTIGELAGWYQDDILVEEAVAEVGQGFWLILANPGDVYMKEVSPLVK